MSRVFRCACECFHDFVEDWSQVSMGYVSEGRVKFCEFGLAQDPIGCKLEVPVFKAVYFQPIWFNQQSLVHDYRLVVKLDTFRRVFKVPLEATNDFTCWWVEVTDAVLIVDVRLWLHQLAVDCLGRTEIPQQLVLMNKNQIVYLVKIWLERDQLLVHKNRLGVFRIACNCFPI